METSEEQAMLTLRYPIGEFRARENYTINETLTSIEKLSKLPYLFMDTTAAINDKLDKSYRPGGWTALQVINHLADVYTNALLRTKWLLTEENPELKPYDEHAFSKLADSTYHDVDSTLLFIKLLFERVVFFITVAPAGKF